MLAALALYSSSYSPRKHLQQNTEKRQSTIHQSNLIVGGTPKTNRNWDPEVPVDLLREHSQKLQQGRYARGVPSKGFNHVLNATPP